MKWLEALQTARRPVLAFGWGIRLAHAEKAARAFAAALGIPVVVTWGARDIFPEAPTWGTHGVRAGNLMVQHCDWFLAVGTRLDTKATGDVKRFAPLAQKFMVDIDRAEIDKFRLLGLHIEGLVMDASEFLAQIPAAPDFTSWARLCETWGRRYARAEVAGVLDPYQFVAELSSLLRSDDVIVSDTGCSLAWMMQAFRFSGQRFIHAFNNTPMGYGLPAAMGAAFTGRRVILVTGDGGLSVNITELATVARHWLPVKIMLFDNRGHAMCRQTQRQWLGGEYPATSYEGGLASPDFAAVAGAYGIQAVKAQWCDQARNCANYLLASKGPALLHLQIGEQWEVAPMVKWGNALEAGDPQLAPEELERIRQEALGPLKEAA